MHSLAVMCCVAHPQKNSPGIDKIGWLLYRTVLTFVSSPTKNCSHLVKSHVNTGFHYLRVDFSVEGELGHTSRPNILPLYTSIFFRKYFNAQKVSWGLSQ